MKAVLCGRIMPVTAAPIENGMIITDDNGRIAYVGEMCAVPEGAQVIHMEHCTAVPGLIDPHTFISLAYDPRGMNEHSDLDEPTSAINPCVNALDGFYPDDEAIKRARRAGYTTCFVSPGNQTVIGGVGAAFKMKVCNSAEKMLIPGSGQMTATFGQEPVKYASGKGRAPLSKMGLYALLRDFMHECSEYAASDDRRYDERYEAMLPVMRGEMPMQISIYKAADMLNAMRILDPLGIRYIFVNALESYLIPDEIISRDIPCIFGPLLMHPFRSEQWNIRSDTPVVMERAGLRSFSFACNETCEIEFNRAWNGRYRALGMSDERLLEAMTLMPAQILGIADRVGSIKVGKDADIAFFNGDPLSNLSLCCGTMIDGEFYEGQGAAV